MLPLAIVAVAVIGGLFFRDSNSRQRNRMEMERVQRVLISNERVLSLLMDIETGQRGFLLTGDRSYLEPYQNAKTLISFLTEDDKDSQLYALENLMDNIDYLWHELIDYLELL